MVVNVGSHTSISNTLIGMLASAKLQYAGIKARLRPKLALHRGVKFSSLGCTTSGVKTATLNALHDGNKNFEI